MVGNAEYESLDEEKNGSMTRQSGTAMALSQAQWETLQQSKSSPNLPFNHHELQSSGDVNFSHGDVSLTSGDNQATMGDANRTSGDQSGDAWEFRPLPNLFSLSRQELIQYRKSLKERKKTLTLRLKSRGKHVPQIDVIDKELEKLFHLLKWRPIPYKTLKNMTDGELKTRHEELNQVRSNKTYSITDHARVNHERDKIQSLLEERKNSNQKTKKENNSCEPSYFTQKGGNPKESVHHEDIKSMDEEKDIYQGVQAYLKFLRRTKRIKRK